MRRIQKLFLKVLICLFFTIGLFGQTVNDTLLNTFKSESNNYPEILAFAEKNPQDSFEAWKILNKYAPTLKNNIAELDLVSKNLNEINKAGGYLEWKLVSGSDINTLAQIKAEELINKYSKIEPTVTHDLVTLAKKIGGKMAGLEHRLKTVGSLKRKLISDGINEPMNDVMRYTIIFDDHFIKRINYILTSLEKKGYKTFKVKNTFKEGAVYKGINTNLKTPEGYVFEIQYHTTESFEVKQNINHKLYEEYRLLDPKSEEAIKLNEEMTENSNSIKLPKHIETLKSFK